MKKRTALLLFIIMPLIGVAQPLTLDTCIQKAYRHFAFEKQATGYRQSAELAIQNVNKSWLPKMLLDATATYQNEQITIPIEVPLPGFEIPEAPLNFNRLLVNFSQNIYDGSVSGAKKKLEGSKYAIQEKQVEVEKIQLKSKVISLFMGIQLTDENLNLLKSKQEIINKRFEVLNEAAKYGGATKVNIKLLEAELIKIEQSIIEATHSRLALVASLGELMGDMLSPGQSFVRPDPQVTYKDNVENRPEITLLDMQMQNIEFQQEMISTSRNPRINLFGTVGGGNPGYDIFKKDPAFMGMVGLKLQWNIIDWNFSKNEKQILSINSEIVMTRKERARTQLLVELRNQQFEIEKYASLLQRDEKLVGLRAEVSQIKAAELDNGTITTTDYLTEINAEEDAKLNQKMHELRLIMAKLNYITIQGN
jgi:outer membrane protein TolC